jgi:hypothetical protein
VRSPCLREIAYCSEQSMLRSSQSLRANHRMHSIACMFCSTNGRPINRHTIEHLSRCVLYISLQPIGTFMQERPSSRLRMCPACINEPRPCEKSCLSNQLRTRAISVSAAPRVLRRSARKTIMSRNHFCSNRLSVVAWIAQRDRSSSSLLQSTLKKCQQIKRVPQTILQHRRNG